MALRFFSKPQANPPEVKSAIPLGVVGFTSPGPANWSARDSSALARNGFLNNPIGYRAVKMIAEAAAGIGLNLQDTTTRYYEHPLVSLLKRPNAHQSGQGFLEGLYGQLLLSGNAFIERMTDDEEEVRALHCLRSDRVEVLSGRDGWPDGYLYRVGSKKARYPIDAILHIKSFHPQDDHYGLSPIRAAASAIDVHNSASQWSKALLDNAARPSGAIVYKGVDGHGQMSQNQYDRLVEEIESNHQGARNAGRPMLLEGGLDWKQMGFSPSDMEFHRTKDTAAREIALAFGVPPMLLGIPGDNTYSNYQEANRAFYRQTVLPLARHVAGELTQFLCEMDMAFQVDLDGVTALASEREADWRRIATADFLSDREKRRLLGLPERGDDE